MWGTIIGLAGTAASGIMSAINNKRIADAEERESARKKNFYLAQANENPLERSENAALLGQLDRRLNEQNETAAAKSKIIGGTPEANVATQKATATAYADAVSDIAAGESARRDNAMENYNKAEGEAAEKRIERMAKRGETYANLAANAANAAKGLSGWKSRQQKNFEALVNEFGGDEQAARAASTELPKTHPI